MSDITGELARILGAYEQPTLTLLNQRAAPVIMAVFRSSFGRDTRSVPATRLHDQVDTYLAELRHAGMADVPNGTGRELCLRWMRGQWLVRTTEEDGTESYSLTSHAQDALTLVKNLSRDRASLSEHRVSTIVNAVRRFNTDANPDRDARLASLAAEIKRLDTEYQRLKSGGEVVQVSADYMLEGYIEILGLIGGLPGDFSRVEESFANLRSAVLNSFRAESRPAGEVIDDYLSRADSLMTSTAEGRAFEGAFTLLRDDELLLGLREDLTALLSHPHASQILSDGDRRELRDVVALIRRGIEDVLIQRSKVTATLRDYIVTHDITRDRELDAILRQLDGEITTWMQTAGPRAVVPLALLPPRSEVTHLRERFYDPQGDVAPPPLRDVSDHAPEPLSLQDLLSQGGPSLGQLRERLAASLDTDNPIESLGALFDTLDPDLRRPVEIFGLLHLATNLDMRAHPTTEPYVAVRTDGTKRELDVPVVSPYPPAEQESR